MKNLKKAQSVARIDAITSNIKAEQEANKFELPYIQRNKKCEMSKTYSQFASPKVSLQLSAERCTSSHTLRRDTDQKETEQLDGEY